MDVAYIAWIPPGSKRRIYGRDPETPGTFLTGSDQQGVYECRSCPASCGGLNSGSGLAVNELAVMI
jgi:hypothetical protein